MSMRVAMVGVTGQIGSAVIDALTEAGTTPSRSSRDRSTDAYAA